MTNTPRNSLSASATPEGWLSVARVAFVLGVSERTVRRRCEVGRLRARLETTGAGVAWLIDPALRHAQKPRRLARVYPLRGRIAGAGRVGERVGYEWEKIKRGAPIAPLFIE